MKKNYVITKIIGGLGNQIFQYACGYSLARNLNIELKLDVQAFQKYTLHNLSLQSLKINNQNATPREINKLRKKWLIYPNHRNVFKERQFSYDPEFQNISHAVYLDGYWQSERYFQKYRNELIEILKPRKAVSEYTQKILQEINNTTSISMHIRRGDYVNNEITNSIHGTCDLSYYHNAQNFLLENIDKKNAKIFVFSDDIPWAKNSIKSKFPLYFVDGNDASRNYEDMYLMSSCNHNIIANSSFSWWGAWLNNNSKKIVIAPDRWFTSLTHDTKDLIPDNWIKLH